MASGSQCRRTRLWVTVGACCVMWTISASAQSLISADYGSGNNRVDVTSRIQSLIQNGALSIRVNNQSMGMDPDPGHSKDLRIHAREAGGRVRDYIFRENEVANLQFDVTPPGDRDADDRGLDRDRGRDRYGDRDRYDDRDRERLVIVSAFYGINTATVEVTGHLQDMVKNNALVVRVNNETMGADPAHEHGKVLSVVYRLRGERHAAIVRETDELRIP